MAESGTADSTINMRGQQREEKKVPVGNNQSKEKQNPDAFDFFNQLAESAVKQQQQNSHPEGAVQ